MAVEPKVDVIKEAATRELTSAEKETRRRVIADLREHRKKLDIRPDNAADYIRALRRQGR